MHLFLYNDSQHFSQDSDDEQQDNDLITPIPYTRGIQSTSLEFDHIPSTSVKHHQHQIEERRHETQPSKRNEKETHHSASRTFDYDSGIGTNNWTKLSHERLFPAKPRIS